MEPPDGWTVWNEEAEGRVVQVYRPDVFEGESFPAPCLPTLTVGPGRPDQRRRRAGQPREGWHVALFLEPEVRVRERDGRHDERDDALAAAREVARAFHAGEVDYRAAYQVPREEYLDRLDELTGDRGG